MLDGLFQSKNSSDLGKQLIHGCNLLWKDQTEQAGRMFEQVATKAQEQAKRGRADGATHQSLLFQANLGLWAVRYLHDQRCRSELVSLLQSQSLDVECAAFLAKVLHSRHDTSDEALKVYRTLLRLDPSPKVARRVRDLVAGVTFSHPALALYIVLEQIIADDLALASKLCRWYLHVSDKENARQLAKRILEHDPSHRDARRCLGVLAEQQQDWDNACHYYRLSRDYLRLAVVAARAERYSVALDALNAVTEAERTSSTWLYYRGWVAYRQGMPAVALTTWAKLLRSPTNLDASIWDSLNVLVQQVLYHCLQKQELPEDVLLELRSLGIDTSSLDATAGARAVLCEGDVTKGKALLHQALRHQKNNLRVVSYLALAEALERDDAATDQRMFQQLVAYFKDASLFLWLRGLTLLQRGSRLGSQYLNKSIADGVCERHLPPEALLAGQWLMSAGGKLDPTPSSKGVRIDTEQLEQALAAESAFAWAIVTSYTLINIAQLEPAGWIALQPPAEDVAPMWRSLQAAYFCHQKDWAASLTLIDEREVATRWRVTLWAMDEALRQEDWMTFASFVSQCSAIGQEGRTLKQLEQLLRPQMYQLLWQRGELERLDYELELVVRAGSAPTDIYHALALVYTRLAVTKDQRAASVDGGPPERAFSQTGLRTQTRYTGFLEGTAHNDYWLLAIGCWAVALSDPPYWAKWAQQRSAVYDETVTGEQLSALTSRSVPDALRAYHEEQIQRGCLLPAHHRFYAAIVSQELEATQAMRHLLRQLAGRSTAAVPEAIQHFISPLLIKKHGYSEQARTLLHHLEGLPTSPYELGLVRQAFSPAADVVALNAVHAYDTALTLIRKHLAAPEYPALRNDLQRVFCDTLERTINHHIELEQWHSALQLAYEGLRVQPQSKDFQQLVAKAACGLATFHVRDEQIAEAVKVLEKASSALPRSDAELEHLLGEVYVDWGYEAGKVGDLDRVILRLGKAVELLPDNARAHEGLNIAYYQRALKKAQSGSYIDALQDAKQALRYGEDPETLVLLARVHRSCAIELDEKKRFSQSHPHWEAALEYARQVLEYEEFEEGSTFFTELCISRILSFYKADDYPNGIDMAERLIAVLPGPSDESINLRKLLSEMYTNYGAQLYNDGNRRQGAELTRKALQYDPSNQVARQNLGRM